MSQHYPKIRLRSESGYLLIREGLSLTFYMRRSHAEVAPAVPGLRTQLHSSGSTVRELDAERAVVTLGPWPEAGDTEKGQVLPAYRELARVLEPWLYHEKSRRGSDFTSEDTRRWERRFLD